MTNLNKISKQVYEANKLKGFDVKTENIGQTLCLIHSEISEALEAVRKNRYADIEKMNNQIKDRRNRIDDILNFKIPARNHTIIEAQNETEDFTFKNSFQCCIKDTFEDEIADTFIRLMDLVGALEIDIDSHIEVKRRYNSLREFKHGKDF